MSNEVLTALLALVGTIVGSGSGILISNKLVNYRIEQLEKKVDKYAESDLKKYQKHKELQKKNQWN